MNTTSQNQSNTTIYHFEAEDHRLTVGDLRNFDHLSEDLMFDLSNEEFEKMMGSVDPETCIEPLYFPMSYSEYETQSVGYY